MAGVIPFCTQLGVEKMVGAFGAGSASRMVKGAMREVARRMQSRRSYCVLSRSSQPIGVPECPAMSHFAETAAEQVTLPLLQRWKNEGRRLVMTTAYDTVTARMADPIV